MSSRYMFSQRQRIDARPQNDPATQAGLRNVHRDMSGNVIGATTPEGYGIGTKNRSWQTAPSGMDRKVGLQPGKSQLGAPATPGLDRLAAMNAAPAGESFAATEKRKRRESAASGAFGAKPQNLAQRQQLFADMKKSGTQSPDLAKRAAGLGVSRSQYDRAWSKIPSTGQGIAAAAKPAPTAPAGSLAYGYGSSPKAPQGNSMPELAGTTKPRKWRL